jgi:NADP-dependent 3-hydroxy acid dehydrogenase YdfG
MRSFDGKVAAITGAGSGIGRALAVELGKQGCHLSLSDINEAGLVETVTMVRPLGVRVTRAKLDVADRAAVHDWADAKATEHGGVNLVFNNAGVALGCTLETVSYEDLEWIMNINFWGVVHGTKAFLPHLHASGDGHVINISSIFGIIAVPGNGAYNATKFAVRGFTEALRQELELEGAKVSATSVHPVGIKTNIARSSRISKNIKRLLDNQNPDQAREKMDKMFLTTPTDAALTILNGVKSDKRRVLIGRDAHAIDLVARMLPEGYQHLTKAMARRLTQ